MDDSDPADSKKLTAETLQTRILTLSQGDTFSISGVPQFGYSLQFIQARSDGQGFHAIETESTEIVGHDEPFKHIWAFIIDPERGGSNNGVVTAYSTRDGVVSADATAATANPQEYKYSRITECYPKAFESL